MRGGEEGEEEEAEKWWRIEGVGRRQEWVSAMRGKEGETGDERGSKRGGGC